MIISRGRRLEKNISSAKIPCNMFPSLQETKKKIMHHLSSCSLACCQGKAEAGRQEYRRARDDSKAP